MRTIIALLLLCLFSQVKADQCVGFPTSLGQGGNCGGPVNCIYGTYCDTTATCSQFIATQGACNTATGNTNQCGPMATCKGATGSQTCVANSGPGGACSISSTDSAPVCAYGNNFCLNNVCQGGLIGDTCTQNSDCNTNLTCSSGVCVGLNAGEFCTGTYQCQPGNVCVNQMCTAQITTGNCTNIPSICAFPSICLGNPNDGTSQCVAATSVPAGGYCGGIGAVCQNTLRCANNYCASARVTNCYSGSDCSADEYCTCSGEYLPFFLGYSGYGTCQKNQCLDAYTKYLTCLSTNCQSAYQTNFAGSCILSFCKTQYTNYMQCNGASQLAGSLFLVVAALLVNFFSKKI